MEIAALEQQLAQAHRGVVGVGKERVLDNHAAAPSRLEDLDEVLEKQERRLPGADGEVLLHFLALLAAEGRIGHHHLVAVLLLNVGQVFGERVGVDDVGRFDAVQDHVHDGNHVGQRLFLFAVEGSFLESFEVFGGKIVFGFHVIK